MLIPFYLCFLMCIQVIALRKPFQSRKGFGKGENREMYMCVTHSKLNMNVRKMNKLYVNYYYHSR